MRSTPAGFPAWYPGWLLSVERWYWRQWHKIRYPRACWYDWRKWRSRPVVGQQVEDCRGEIHTVVRLGTTPDDLIFEDGHSASWMSCCDWPEGVRR